PYGVRLAAGAGDPGELEPVRERWAAVQDEGSQLCALALASAPIEGSGTRWLGLCAGPGGKAALLGALGDTVGATLDAGENGDTPRQADRDRHRRASGHRARRRRQGQRAGTGLRPGAGRRTVHRAGRAAQETGGALAASTERRVGPGGAADRAAHRRDGSGTTWRCRGVRGVLATPGGDRRRGR